MRKPPVRPRARARLPAADGRGGRSVTRERYARLKLFLHRKSARQKVIIYLIAAGYTVPELIRLDVRDVRGLALPIDLAVLTEEFLEGRKSGPAFQYPGGKAMPHTAFYRLIRSTSQKVTGKPMTQEQFRGWLRRS